MTNHTEALQLAALLLRASSLCRPLTRNPGRDLFPESTSHAEATAHLASALFLAPSGYTSETVEPPTAYDDIDSHFQPRDLRLRSIGYWTMSRRTFADELEKAANRLDKFSQSDLQALLRRAALRFRNSVGLPLERDSDDILASIAAGIGLQKAELIRQLLREWLEDNGYLPMSRWSRQKEDRTSLPPGDFPQDRSQP